MSARPRWRTALCAGAMSASLTVGCGGGGSSSATSDGADSETGDTDGGDTDGGDTSGGGVDDVPRPQPSEGFEAGFDVRDISPNDAELMLGVYMGAYGAPEARGVATGVHDPVYARTVALREGDEEVIMTILDLPGLGNRYTRRIREDVAALTGLDPAVGDAVRSRVSAVAPPTPNEIAAKADPNFVSGLDAVVFLDLPQDRPDAQPATLRALGRRVDPETGAVYHLVKSGTPPPLMGHPLEPSRDALAAGNQKDFLAENRMLAAIHARDARAQLVLADVLVRAGQDDAARAAIDALNGKELDGRSINVNEARAKTERSGGGGGRRGGW